MCIAHVIHGERVAENARPIGRKIGFTNSALWPKFGVSQPVWAYVYDTTVIELRDAHATFSLRNLVEPKIEPEIIFKLHELPARAAGLVELLKSVERVAHGFEIVQSHYPGWKLKAADAVADSGCTAHCWSVRLDPWSNAATKSSPHCNPSRSP